MGQGRVSTRCSPRATGLRDGRRGAEAEGREHRALRRSLEEPRLHEVALRVVEAREAFAAVLFLEGPPRLDRVPHAQLGVARVAGREDVGRGRERRVAGKAHGAVGGAAEAQEEVALGLLTLEARSDARRVRPRRRGEHEPEGKGREPGVRHRRRIIASARRREKTLRRRRARAPGVNRGLAEAGDDGIRAGMGLLDLLGGGAPGVGVGDPAPDFALPDRAGRTVRLGDYRGRKAVVLYFYPKDETPGCTKEACSFRDQYQDFQDAGAEVIGVSSDPAASHEKFAAKYHLPFVLLADRSGAVRKQYGVPATF